MLIGAQILGMALHTSSGSDVRRPNGANNGARALEAGVHLKIASARLGHASETFTASVYQHAFPRDEPRSGRDDRRAVPGRGAQRQRIR